MSGDPDWQELYARAEPQQGLFTTEQAAEAGYSLPALTRHLQSGRVVRLRRGIYRIVHFPPGSQEDLIELWLWSRAKGTFSHETALGLHELSDALPNRFHMTVPDSWRRRRLQIPDRLTLYYSDLKQSDQTWVDAVPATTAARTIVDCATANVSKDVVAQALREARTRGVVTDELLLEAMR